MEKKTVSLIVVLFSLPLILCSCSTGEIEKNKYNVIKKDGSFEIRQYEPYIIAETLVDSDFKEAGNIAFRRLFKYISGDNRTQESIAMTAPVNQQPASEKIAMTAPVNQQKMGGKFAVSFVMPSKYTMETLPQPLAPDIIIKEVAGYKAAAVRYSGTWSQKQYNTQKDALEAFIQKEGLVASGKATFARYDPPFQIWFLRRNEVIIPVE